MHLSTETKSVRIDIRTTATIKHTLQEAAATKHKTVTEFVLEVALAEAAEVLAEHRLFKLEDKQWADFLTALDAPTKRRPRLEALMHEPSVFE